ncbi:unnamed protein product [Prunus armeniaca]
MTLGRCWSYHCKTRRRLLRSEGPQIPCPQWAEPVGDSLISGIIGLIRPSVVWHGRWGGN